jgi:hypothetical protein
MRYMMNARLFHRGSRIVGQQLNENVPHTSACAAYRVVIVTCSSIKLTTKYIYSVNMVVGTAYAGLLVVPDVFDLHSLYVVPGATLTFKDSGWMCDLVEYDTI